jgi:predicted outer membrane protein
MIRTMARRGLVGGAAALVAATFAVSGCAPEATEMVVVQPAAPGVAPVPVRLTEANMAALVIAANDATTQRAQVAQARAADPEVRAFAGRVLSESQTAGQIIRQQLQRHRITPQPEQTAFQIGSNASQTVAEMQRAQGLNVDRIYLQSEIDNRRWLIQTLDSAIPAVPARAQQELRTLRADLNAKLQEAERLQTRVEAEARAHPVRPAVRPIQPAPRPIQPAPAPMIHPAPRHHPHMTEPLLGRPYDRPY